MLSLKKALMLFTASMRRLNLSLSTQEQYINFVKKFFAQTKHKDVREVKKEDIERYLDYLFSYRNKKGGKLKEMTIHALMKALRAFFNFLLNEEYILLSPCDGVELRPAVRRIRSVLLSEGEIQKLLDSIKTEKASGLRNKTIIELLYATGLRRSELLNLKIQDINLDEGLLFVKGKGNKERVVPLGDNMLRLLKEYLQKARSRYVRDCRLPFLFLNHQGEKMGAGGLTAILKKYLKLARIKKKVCLHSLRHSFSTHMLKGGAEIRYIQAILGHESLSTTQIYLNLSVPGLHKVYEDYHPLENELFFDVRERERYILTTPLRQKKWGWKRKWKKRVKKIEGKELT